jgi:hypothetical protein
MRYKDHGERENIIRAHWLRNNKLGNAIGIKQKQQRWLKMIKALENKAATEHINIRDAVSGRTEGFKSYVKCNE